MQHYDARKARLGGKPPNLVEVAQALQGVLSGPEISKLVANPPAWVDQVNRLDCNWSAKAHIMQRMVTGGENAQLELDAYESIQLLKDSDDDGEHQTINVGPSFSALFQQSGR